MSILSTSLDLIRRVFRRDQMNLPGGPDIYDSMNFSSQALGGMNLGMGSPQNEGSNYLSESVAIEQDIVSRYQDSEEMDQYPEISCLQGDSMVFTVGGGWQRIADLVGKKFRVIAYSKETRQFIEASGEAILAAPEGHKKPMVHIYFGDNIICTADHPFLTASGKWVEAGQLKIGQELMSDLKVKPTVLGVYPLEQRPAVYDLQVPGYHNFLCNSVIVHNTAFDIFADDTTVQDVLSGRSLWFEAPDQVVQDLLEEMCLKQLRIEEDLWEIARGIAKWGNEFKEIIAVDRVGVVELRNLHAPTMRRIQDPYGMLYGFIQDPALGFSISTQAFLERLQTKGAMDNYMDQVVAQSYDDLIQVYEPWEVVHFRNRSSNSSDPYGLSIADAARYAWRRLMMMEDSMVLYKLCLRGDSRVWTTKGTTQIKDLVEGDEVYSYAAPGELKRTKVIYKKCNGRDKIYRVKSRHRDLYANATHPVLVETIECHGSGLPRTRRLDYVEVQNLIPGVHRFCTPSRADGDFESVRLKMPVVDFKARLKPEYCNRYSTSRFSVEANKMGVSYPYLRRFLSGESSLRLRAAVALVEHLGLSKDTALDIVEDWGGAKDINLPDFVDEKFAQWFGFMLGDGHLSDFENQGFRHRRVGFSLGDDQAMNLKYLTIFQSYVGTGIKFGGDQDYRYGYYQVSSKAFCEFMLLNGFIPGAHNKVVPEWIYRCSPSIKLAFLEGFADADGHWTTSSVSKIRKRMRYARARIGLCNLELVEGLRDLAMQTGLTVTRVYTRFQDGGRIIKGTKTPLPDRYCYWFDIVYKDQPRSDKIQSVELIGEDEIWDIGVEADEHNFVADGVVVHNTRSCQRYAFYVDVGDVPPNQAKNLLNQVKNDFRKKSYTDRNGKLQTRYSPLASDEDFFLPVRKGNRATEVDILSGPDGQQIDDVHYFKEKLIGALKIPKSYLGGDDTVGRANLAQLDVRLARSVMRIQRQIKNGMKQVARVDLAAKNIDPDLVEFECHMNIPSGVLEMAQMEVQNAKLDLADKYQRANFPEYFIWSNILGLSDDEIEHYQSLRRDQQQDQYQGGQQQESVRATSKMIDEARRDRMAQNEANRILEEISAGRTDFAKRMRELKMLIGDVRQSQSRDRTSRKRGR